ncbi:hypothetical protein QOZ80_5AG0361730 [Eleusine coracana subsp. coracana]|nr:hypothetical protein QOZ80_5AG0361730 [Eleusine coracana subsp. coracana]
MSGAGAGDQGGHDHGLYGDPNNNPTAGLFNPFDHDDVDSFFLHDHNRSPCAAGEGGIGGDGYASITDYLQGFLVDDGVKQEMVVTQQVMMSRHRGDLQMAHGAPMTTPNSSALSSSSEAIGGEKEQQFQCRKGRLVEEEEIHDHDDEGSAADHNCKRSSKEEKKKKKKTARQPRVAFKTKSEVDHLEDGYRWRKYGQKAVKNSSYPRSYYRCTAARCGVKKLVERSQQDPSSVITTYEGQHTHPNPVGTGARTTLLLQHQPQLGFIRSDDLARMAYAHGHMPPPTAMHKLS